MPENQNILDKLNEKLNNLLKKQEFFYKEVSELRQEINSLKIKEKQEFIEKKIEEIKEFDFEEKVEIEKKKIEVEKTIEEEKPAKPVYIQKTTIPKTGYSKSTKPDFSDKNFNWEKFIGENLINKIAIIILVIGASIGVKYSIDNELLNPLTRVILGYFLGISLLGFGIKLKKKYENFSAVLVSGAMAIMYFITFSAYSFYGLIPQTFSFALMVIFTIFTVIAAINYNKQIIAHIGLVGAYAVPYLLSNGSGKIEILFSYIALINIGILVIAFKKYWKPLYFSSFVLTWIIYTSWYSVEYNIDEHFNLSLIFLSIFFVIFYSTFLAYKLIRKEVFEIQDIILVLINSFIFYGIGYATLNEHVNGKELLGLFTLVNAIIHFIVSAIIFKQKLADKNLFFMISGMVLVFLTISIPVQLDGNWVTLLWIGEAVLLFWIGRTKKIPTYEYLSYPLMILAFSSLIHDWEAGYAGYSSVNSGEYVRPIFNINFLTSLFFIGSFLYINFLNNSKKHLSPYFSKNKSIDVFSYSIGGILLLVLYFAFRVEITSYFDQLSYSSKITIPSESDKYFNYKLNTDLINFKTICLLIYSLLFFTLLSFVNIKKLKNKALGFANLIFNAISLVVFLFVGLYTLSELRENYIEKTLAEYYIVSDFNIGIRYISFIFVALILFASYKYILQKFMQLKIRILFDAFLYITIIWIASSELISIMDFSNSINLYKLGLSILWGVYSLIIVALGIWKNKKHIRIGAIILFGITLIKVFFYDLTHLNTLSKTIVFISLGILLLIISFLYNKFKNKISDEN